MIFQPNNKKDVEDHHIKISLSSVQDLEQVDTYKYLGVIFVKKLTWVPHIQRICKKLAQSLGIIRHIKKFATSAILSSIYYSFVYSHLNYGIISWCSAGETALKPLKQMHQKIIKIIESKSISNCSSNTPSKKFSITKIYELEIGKFVFQYHKGKLPTIFTKYFSKLDQKHKCETRLRNTKKHFLPRFNLKKTQKQLRFTGPKIWSQIPNNPKSISFQSFTSGLREMYLTASSEDV